MYRRNVQECVILVVVVVVVLTATAPPSSGRRNAQEAIIECHTIDFMAELLQKGTRCSVLKFYRKKKAAKGAGVGGDGVSEGTSDAGSMTPYAESQGGDSSAPGDEEGDEDSSTFQTSARGSGVAVGEPKPKLHKRMSVSREAYLAGQAPPQTPWQQQLSGLLGAVQNNMPWSGGRSKDASPIKDPTRAPPSLEA